jgi:hypothetical protein
MKKMDLAHFTHHKYDNSHAQADTDSGREQVKNVQDGREMGVTQDSRPSTKVGSREKTVPPPKS